MVRSGMSRCRSDGVLARHRALPLPDKPSIAILPFANMSGDPEQEHFADGIAEDILTGLAAPAMAVRDRSQLELHLQGPPR
jgi:TolB-like protein